MNPLILEPTKTNPYICFDPVSGLYEMSGKSFSENPQEIFNIVFKWLDNNLTMINHKMEINIQADYFNSVSKRLLLKMLRIFETHFTIGKNIEIIWIFSDEEVENDGIIFSQLISIPFKFKDISENS